MFLIKLLYLSDKESLNRYDEPITGDSFYSMNQGPVLTSVLDCINSPSDASYKYWNDFIQLESRYYVTSKSELELDDLSEADIEILDFIYDENIVLFDEENPFKYINMLHDKLPEWTNPNGSSKFLPVEDVLKSLGKTSENISAIQENLINEHEIEGNLGSCL